MGKTKELDRDDIIKHIKQLDPDFSEIGQKLPELTEDDGVDLSAVPTKRPDTIRRGLSLAKQARRSM